MGNPEMAKPPLKFPPYRRRRPLKSQSLSTFIRILSECQQHFQLHNPGFTTHQMDIDGLESVDNVKSNGNQGKNVDSINGMESVVEGSRNGNSDFAAFASLNNNDNQFSLPDFKMDEFGLEEQVGEKAPCVDVSGLIDSLLETDVTAGASKPDNKEQEKISPVKRDNTETQMKGRESDIPVSASVMVSSSLQKFGEISKNSGVLEKSSDLLREDVASLEKNSVNKGRVSGDLIQKEGFGRNALQRGIEKENKYNGLSRSEVNTTSTAINVPHYNTKLVENRSKLVYYGDIVADDRAAGQDCKNEFGRNRQRCGFTEANSPASCPKILTLSGGSTGENTVENQCSASTEKVTNLNNKKRKQGPGSEERKAKKKRKERMKHAEENRKLGVNRLKLAAVSKPKKIKYCHHFVKGRCHEGEKCKFSHDTVPLTKSKACCHFSRQSCMKGDDCSYDHQLSKYPCNNYLSTGSCSRGSNCMFSHDVVPVKEGSSTAFEQQSIPVKETSNLKKPTSKQNVNAKLCSSGISLSMNEKQNGPAEQSPEGIGFLSHGKVPLGNMSKNGQGALSPKADNGAKGDQQRISGASDVAESLNKNTQRTPAVLLRGVNFLSFAKTPFESSSSKRSSFSSISNLKTGKSPLSDADKREQNGSSSKTDDGVKVESHIGRGASSIFQNLNETTNRTPAMTPRGLPAMTPRGLSFLSVGNHLDSSFNKKLAGSHLNKIDTVLPTNEISASVNNKVHSPSPVLPQVSSSLPPDLSLGKLIDAQSRSSLSASQGSFLTNTPSSVQRALRSTLTLAAKFESESNKDCSYVTPAVSTNLNKEASRSQNKLTKASTILDFLYGANSKTKQ